MKYYLIAGEASGDLHASNLMRALKTRDADAEFRFFGGDLMQMVGGTLVKHYGELAYMGFVQVALPFGTCPVAAAKSSPQTIQLEDSVQETELPFL